MPHRSGKGKHFRPVSKKRPELAVLRPLSEARVTRRNTLIAQNLSEGAGLTEGYKKRHNVVPKTEQYGVDKVLGYKVAKSGVTSHKRANIGLNIGEGGSGKQGMIQKQFAVKDNELYDEKLDVSGGSKEQSMVRVGTTPSHLVPLVDKFTGETRLVRIRKQPRYGVVGEQTSIPKDGGK